MACNCLCRPLLSNLLKSMLLLLQLLDFDSEVSAARNKRKEALFYSIESASHVGNIIKVEKTKSGLDCAFLCLQMPQGSCLSFNFGRIATNGLHICELSNSERALEPHKLLNRINFVYYGMKMSDLTRFLPCLSSPCRNGGLCVNGPTLEMFTCNCSLEIRVLPYIDHKCNVNESHIEVVKQLHVQGVMQAQVGKLQLNYFEAMRLCEILNGSLATLDQLTAAWQAGLQICR
ncbi:unnamed protein product [Porites lobata]|uniref:EGF-like domain-containing protein n=1 Tax=Porites lobata TaxID=104759 RepID=A0ABN8N2B6_9CNID|nr:unnamed protein product [Porites lobata]